MAFGWSVFGKKKAYNTTAAQVLAGEARFITQVIASEMPPVPDEDFGLHLQGFENDDPVLRTTREERVKRLSQDMIQRQRAEEDDLRHRMQTL